MENNNFIDFIAWNIKENNKEEIMRNEILSSSENILLNLSKTDILNMYLEKCKAVNNNYCNLCFLEYVDNNKLSVRVTSQVILTPQQHISTLDELNYIIKQQLIEIMNNDLFYSFET